MKPRQPLSTSEASREAAQPQGGAPRGQTMKRRDFLKITGSGLIVFFSVRPRFGGAQETLSAASPRYPTDLNAYLRIGADGRVTCFVGKVELGQGSMTALAQLLAEELDVPLASVNMVMGDTDRCPWDGGTVGSQSIRIFGAVLRRAAAEARLTLLDMAAAALGAPVARLRTGDGAVSDSAPNGRAIRYADLVRGKRIERRLESAGVAGERDARPAPKPASAFRVVGTSPPRADAIDKVTGRARYAGDIVLPGMLHARLLRPPAHGALPKEVDTRKAEAVEGVRVVRDDDLIAVLHERPDEAERARALIAAQFTRSAPRLDDRTVFDHLVKAAPAGALVAEGGSLAEGERLAADRFEHTYFNGYVAHAAIETHSAVAQANGTRMTVWVSTQSPFRVQAQIARALGVQPDNVRVITPYVGGGFGGKSVAGQAVEAARLARLTGRPIQVVWSRAEEFFYDTFRPAAVVRIRSGTTAAAKLAFWDFTVFAAGDREARTFYDVPHHRTISHGGWMGASPGLHPFAIGPWRAPSVNTNTFARESQVDIMAARARMDPLAFRLSNIGDPRMHRALHAVEKAFGWTPSPVPSGRGVGVACAMYLGTYVATMAEVAVDRQTGDVRVERVACAQDMGVVVNPDGARQQTEGCITMGLGYALAEEVRFSDGEVLDRNFDTYEIPRFSWLPEITTVLVDAGDQPSQGCGEPPIVTMGAAIANAICDAVGVRLFQLPMTPARVKAALAQS